jgi:hypothetical protein
VFLLSVWFSPANAQKGIDVVGVDANGQETRGQKWAVVIGINQYDRATPLRHCVADAKSLFSQLYRPRAVISRMRVGGEVWC